MKTRRAAIGVMLFSVMARLSAHQLDEYLLSTILAVEKTSIRVDMFLTPGVAVLPVVLRSIDADGDGVISPTEQRTYAGRVLRDLSMTVNDARLAPRLVSAKFPTVEEMKEGRGDIHLEFSAALPLHQTAARKFRLENQHQRSIAAYQVNCLVPTDPAIRLGPEHRNYAQSVYTLEFTRADGAHRTAARLRFLFFALPALAVVVGCRLAPRFWRTKVA